jgi:hypothetical protein
MKLIEITRRLNKKGVVRKRRDNDGCPERISAFVALG